MADTPKRIQRKRTKGWRMPEGATIVDRSSRSGFGNPFPVQKSTSTSMGKTSPVWIVGTWNGPAMWIVDTKREATDIAVKAFAAWVSHPAQGILRATAKIALKGNNLACWCRLCPAHADGKPFGVECADCDPCHADTWLKIANEADNA
jgi:hypothetical protein